MSNISLSLPIFILLISCRAVNGVYADREQSLILADDSTFRYTYSIGWQKKYAEGRWSHIVGNRYLIQSDGNPKIMPVRIATTESSTCGLTLTPIKAYEGTDVNYFGYDLMKDTVVVLKLIPFQKVLLPDSLLNTELVIRLSSPDEEIRPYVINKFLYTEEFNVNCLAKAAETVVKLKVDLEYAYLTEIETDTISVRGDKLIWADRKLKRSKSEQ